MTKPAITREPASNIEWQLFGKLDVGVSHDHDAGLAEWAILKHHLKHYGLNGWNAACEIGCGTGRMCNAVAEDFAAVHALDVSEERLQQAGNAKNAAKCHFHLVSEPIIPLHDASCDLVYSIHVFQHFSSMSVVHAYYREAYRVLRPGGVLMLHLPMAGAHGITGELGEVLRRRIAFAARSVTTAMARVAVRMGLEKVVTGTGRLLQRSGIREHSGGTSIYRVFSFANESKRLQSEGFGRIELRVLPVRGYHSYVFVAKS